MTTTYRTLLSDNYLRAVFAKEFEAFKGSEEEKTLVARLKKWSEESFRKKPHLRQPLWACSSRRHGAISPAVNLMEGTATALYPQFPISGAGAGGGTGGADAALGIFDCKGLPETPQVLCEFKDVRSNLDGPQKRKGNNRSPVKQCADYLREAMKPLFGNKNFIQPTWGVVTDMNEFRLYWRNTECRSQFQR